MRKKSEIATAAKAILLAAGGDKKRALAIFRRSIASMTVPCARLTQTRLTERLRYDPETGLFYWVSGRSDRVGKVAGGISPLGYWQIRVDDLNYTGHRLAVLYMTGEFPPSPVDHKNGVKHDNRWDNLRVVSQSQNIANSSDQKTKLSGLPRGVADRGKGTLRYRAIINVGGKMKIIGSFKTPDEAGLAYKRKSLELHGEYSVFAREPNEKATDAAAELAKFLRAA